MVFATNFGLPVIVLLDKMPVYKSKCLILWQSWRLQIGVPFPDYWCAPGAGSHLLVPGVTGGGKMCFNDAFMGHPLKYEGT